jgi:hypothetical protein
LITTGSKYFFGLGLVAFFTAVVYGIVTNGFDHGGIIHLISGDGAVNALLGPLTFGYKGGVGDHVGYGVLMGFSFTSFGLGIASSAFRDSDAEALAQLEATDTAPAISRAIGLNAWPAVGALGGTVVLLGWATSPILFVIGAVTVSIATVEWTISNWAEHASGDALVNRAVRNRVMLPVEIPVGAVIVIGGVVFCMSRLLLAASEDGSIFVSMGFGLAIFLGAIALGTGRQVRRNVVVGALVFGALAVLGVGIAGAIAGPRHFEKHTAKQEGAAAPSAPSTLGDN